MDPRNSIEIRGVCKSFDVKRTVDGHGKDVSRQVIRSLDLDVRKGECLGVVGRNGSGKSTLLKLISRIIYPDSGTIDIQGNVASILELGMGFHQDLSGRENIYIKSSMFGFSKKETDSMIDGIIEFSELGEQIDDPLRTYSSGMVGRLAFSVLINVRCDIMIVDEILSVGDVGFQEKCAALFERLKKAGKTIIFASNVGGSVESMCDRAVWIDEGAVRESGDPEEVCFHYTRCLVDSPDMVRASAEAGDAVSQNRLGTMLRDGSGVEKDPEAAEAWFRKAASLGSIDATVNLADILDAAGKTEEARDLYLKAASRGNQYAGLRLGSSGAFSECVSVLKKLSSEGSARASAVLWDVYSKGAAVRQDRSEAVRWMAVAAERGDVQSMLMLGLAYRDGAGVGKDPEKAIQWLSSAAERGNARARNELVSMYRKGMGVERDMKAAIHWLERSASAGDASAMFQLGSIFRDGTGVDPDPAESERWISMFSSASGATAEFAVADIILKSYRSEKERNEAFRWMGRAASHGSVQAMFQLATMHRDGVGSPADSSKAAELFAKASEHGHAQSILELGLMNLRGNGVPRDVGKAFELISRAAGYGNATARYQLGVLYRDGIGTEKDPEKARSLFSQAAEAGSRDAVLALSKMRFSRGRMLRSLRHPRRPPVRLSDGSVPPGRGARGEAGVRGSTHIGGEGGPQGPPQGGLHRRHLFLSGRQLRRSPGGRDRS